MIHRRRRPGMTFVEILASMTILGIVLPVTVAAILFASRTSTMAVRKRDAAFLADQILQEAVATGSWQDGDSRGEYDGERAGWSWELVVSTWDVEAMQQVAVTVTYTVQGQVYSETIAQLVTAPEESTT